MFISTVLFRNEFQTKEYRCLFALICNLLFVDLLGPETYESKNTCCGFVFIPSSFSLMNTNDYIMIFFAFERTPHVSNLKQEFPKLGSYLGRCSWRRKHSIMARAAFVALDASQKVYYILPGSLMKQLLYSYKKYTIFNETIQIYGNFWRNFSIIVHCLGWWYNFHLCFASRCGDYLQGRSRC